jgi:hypothetical protein
MRWLPVLLLFGFSAGLAVSMIRGGKLGERWYTGGRSRLDRDAEGHPIDRTDNVRSHQWGGTTLDDR